MAARLRELLLSSRDRRENLAGAILSQNSRVTRPFVISQSSSTAALSGMLLCVALLQQGCFGRDAVVNGRVARLSGVGH